MAGVVDLVLCPTELNLLAINSSGTTPITVTAAVTGQIVRIWSYELAGGTSITISDSVNGAISGTLVTTGVATPLPQPFTDATEIFPRYQSAVGNTLTITPGASGLSGTVYWSQN